MFTRPPSAVGSPTLPPVSDAEGGILQPSIITLGGSVEAGVDSVIQTGGSFHFMQESELEETPITAPGIKFGDVEGLNALDETGPQASGDAWVDVEKEEAEGAAQNVEEQPPVSLLLRVWL
jgi:hypothetical protein